MTDRHPDGVVVAVALVTVVFVAQHSGERRTDIGDEALIEFHADQATDVVGLDHTAHLSGGPGHGGAPGASGLMSPVSLAVGQSVGSGRTRRCPRRRPAEPDCCPPVPGDADGVVPSGSENPGDGAVADTRPSRTASANATRSSSSGLVGNGAACRIISQPRGAVIRLACPMHRSQECGSRAIASGPTTAVESE